MIRAVGKCVALRHRDFYTAAQTAVYAELLVDFPVLRHRFRQTSRPCSYRPAFDSLPASAPTMLRSIGHNLGSAETREVRG